MEVVSSYLALEVISVLVIFLLFLWWRSWRASAHQNTVISSMVKALSAEKEARLAAMSAVLGAEESEQNTARVEKIYQKERKFYARLIKAMMTGKAEDFSGLPNDVKALIDTCLDTDFSDATPDELTPSEADQAPEEQGVNDDVSEEQDTNDDEAQSNSPEEEEKPEQEEPVPVEVVSVADQIFQAEETNQELSVKLSVTSSTLGKLLNEFCLRHDGLEKRDLISTTVSNYVAVTHKISNPDDESDDEYESEEVELEALHQRKQKLTTAVGGTTELLILINKTASLISDDDELDDVGNQLIQQLESATATTVALNEEED